MGRMWVVSLVSLAGLCGTTRAAETKYEVETFPDLAYRSDKAADPERHKLDLYVPKGAKDFPVLLFVHGGTWRSGNKSLYTPLGMTFARCGIGAVVINYRLSPKVRHPAHVEDVAQAFAWTVANVGKYGGRADRVFLSGHSAGGHLVSLLALDETYLKAVGRSVADVRGVMAISGVFTILPIRIFESAFGSDEAACKAASPLTHVMGGKHPPFLIAYADKELPGLEAMAKEMYAALKKAGCDATLCEIKDRNHITVIVGSIGAGDPLTKAMREFIGSHAK